MQSPKIQSANIKVFCRFRPFNKLQQSIGSQQNIHKKISEKYLTIKDPSKGDELMFIFDKIFDSDSTQQEIYNEVGGPILNNILDGFNGTIIAYGQTSSGKTHTIQGTSEPNNKGIIPRIIQNLFHAIDNSAESIQFKLKVSILQLYMEKLYDLIDCSKTDLKIRESKLDGPYVENKTEVYISDKFQLHRLINLAQKNRVTCVTNMNQNSSRSHLIFHLTLSQFNSETSQAKTSNLFIVDLAGSEKVSKTGAEGKTLQQAKKINLSLTCLAKVIKSLSQKIPHVPYRDSKLTRIIQDSLGGNSKTTLILTCSPHQSNIPQTISTLRFGETAQKIKNKPKINREPTIQQLQHIIVKLQNKVKAQQKWIQTLQDHIKNKMGISLPKISQQSNSPLRNGNYKQQRLCSTSDLGQLKNIPISSTLTLASLIQQQQMDDQNVKFKFDKYLAESLNIPQLAAQRLYENDEMLLDNDQQIYTLQKQLRDCKLNLQNQINKHFSLKKQYTILTDNLKDSIQKNLNYEKKQQQLEQTIKNLNQTISRELKKKKPKSEYSTFSLRRLNTINGEYSQNIDENDLFDKQILRVDLQTSLNASTEQNAQILKLKQQNRSLQKMAENIKVQKQMLQFKVKTKDNKIGQLKQMMEQIQQQMEEMAEEYEEPMPINLNTRIANPIKRSFIFE